MNKKILLITLVVAVVAGSALFWSYHHAGIHSDQIQTPRVATPAQPVDLARLRAEAKTGDPAAETKLGWVYERGTGVKPDMKVAVTWFKRAADQKYPDAQVALGEMIQAGQGIKADPAAAARLFLLAATKGNVAGQYDLAYLYEQGIGVKKDETQAAKWYQLAAEGGDPLAQFDIGQRYELGVGVSKDRVRAFKWLSLAAEQGQSDSQRLLPDLKSQMSSDEIAAANKLVKEFAPRDSSSASQIANQ